MNSAFPLRGPQITASSQALHGEKGLIFILGTSCPMLRARASGDQNPSLLLQSGFDLRVRAAASPLLSPPFSFPFPSRLLTALGEGEARRGEPEQGLSQCSGGPRARPPPSLPYGPIGIYYNVVASRGGGARAGRGPRRPRLAEERREGARRGCSLARSLPRSLPPPAGLVS